MNALKKFFPILVLALYAGFSSCSKDDDKDTTTDASALIGTWKCSTSTADVETNNSDVTNLLKTIMSQNTLVGTAFTFKTDGNYSATSEEGSETGTYVAKNGTLTTTASDSEKTIYTYSVSGNKLTLTQDMGTSEYLSMFSSYSGLKITKLTTSSVYNKQ